MRLLIDTNILIHLEDNKIVDDDFYKFYQLAVSNNCQVLYHPDCIKDISKDKDIIRKEILKSKLKKYTKLINKAKLDNNFSLNLGEKKENDRIDNAQLFQVFKGYVEYFITNDNGIHKKARQIEISDKVLTSRKAFELLDKKFTLIIPNHPALEHISVRKLEDDFESTFFESLRQDYGGQKFMQWIEKCSQRDRQCYRLKIDNNLSALLIYNIEDESEHKLVNIKVKALKICTLKVGNDALGLKLGELFLNLMFQLAVNQNIEYVYVTTYEKQVALIHLLEKFGFNKFSTFENSVGMKEMIFLKSLRHIDYIEKVGSIIHPFFRLNRSKYIIPIQPKFYKTLFKDGNLRTPSLFDSEDYGLQEIQGNTIIKAYISKSLRQDLKKGDLLFFYSSEKYKSIEPIGELLLYKRVDNIDELWELVKSKTVYEQKHLKKMLEQSDYLTVTIFRLVNYLKPVVNFDQIKKMESFSNKFQTITRLTENDFNQFIKPSINESFVIH
jgi:hypothetical protein